MMRYYCFVLISLVFLTATVPATAQSAQEVNERINRIIEQYMNTKNGLVHNRDDLSAAWAERLETTIATTPHEIFEEDVVSTWEGYQQVMMSLAGNIVDAEDINGQRQALHEFSEEMIAMLEEFGNPGETLYVFVCGDYGDEDVVWLNDSDRVANPYHGPENLECGRVIAEL
ncbi:DUF3347 domain-containing protein [Balneolales bacterium ANBcel1]|nr:DUF3347 domain-containing protein [Balneolales bacterium ANBcel1]